MGFDIATIDYTSESVIFVIGARNTGKSTFVKNILKYLPPNGTIVCGSEEWNPIYGTKHTEYSLELVKSAKDFIVLDDCIYDPTWLDDILSDKHQSLRIITMLYAMSIPTTANIDYVFIFRENILSNLRKLYDQYVGVAFLTFETFCEAMCLEEYECLVIEKKTTAYHLRNKNR